MKVIRSLSGGAHMLNDFFYAHSEKQNPSEETFNSYYFRSCVVNNFGRDTFEAFADELREESYIIHLESAIINAGNLAALEINTNHSTFIFYFLNNTKFYYAIPTEQEEPLKFSATCKLMCETISKIEKAQKRSILHGTGKDSSPLFSLPNFINN